MAHHDALRLRFEHTKSGWKQAIVDAEESAPFAALDLSELPEHQLSAVVESVAAEMQASLDLTAGPLLRVLLFDLGPQRPGRLLIIAHHLAVDGVSWRILLEDLQTIYQQLSQGQTVQLPPKTTSFQHWAEQLVDYAQSEAVKQELDHWFSVIEKPTPILPVDVLGGTNTEGSARSVTVSLTVEETRALIQDVPAAYRTEINDVLLTALAQAFSRWADTPTLRVHLEGHGREDLFDDVDLSRTAGWFTSIYPVRLTLEDPNDPGKALMSVKEQLRQVPNRGIGFGLLRYLNQDEEIIRQIRPPYQPLVSFNYLGQFNLTSEETPLFQPAPESPGPERGPENARTHLLEIDGGIMGDRLQMEWTYSQHVHQRSTIEQLAHDFVEALRAIITHCQSPEAGGYTASDFEAFGWEKDDLDSIVAEVSRDDHISTSLSQQTKSDR
jgi:non-ribosomal peptide synthase protein (TIGR01720 family)